MMSNDAPENFILVLNRADYVAFHDAMYEWMLGWLEGYGSYEVVDTGDTTLVLPADGLRQRFHTVHLKRPA